MWPRYWQEVYLMPAHRAILHAIKVLKLDPKDPSSYKHLAPNGNPILPKAAAPVVHPPEAKKPEPKVEPKVEPVVVPEPAVVAPVVEKTPEPVVETAPVEAPVAEVVETKPKKAAKKSDVSE